MIEHIIEQSSGFILFTKGQFCHVTHANDKCQNRNTLAHFYHYLETKGDARYAFSKLKKEKRDKSLPKIIRDDRFLAHYAMGRPLSVAMAKKLLKQKGEGRAGIKVGFAEEGVTYFDVDATPPGLLAKLIPLFRLRADREMIEKIRYDLKLAANIENNERRRALTFAILSFSAAYRELDNLVLELPDFSKAGYLVPYKCRQHLIAEGVKTISLSAGKGYPPIYLCQGTEIWPSQPSMLGSILANFAEHGAASQAYAHSWRRIHKQLRDLTGESGRLPFVMGHSMGGSLALQIALYSHDLIASAHAYNPPVAGERDALFYKTLPQAIKDKMQVYANLDDPAFWRIGAKVIGNVTIFLGNERWRYYPVTFTDTLLLLPAAFKFFLNIVHAFPSHQRIVSLCESYVEVRLSEEEIKTENSERKKRFDYLHFFPKLYDPLKSFVSLLRRLFKWRLEEEFLRNEIEILALHERDLIDTRTEQNKDDVKKKLESLSREKQILQKKLFTNN